MEILSITEFLFSLEIQILWLFHGLCKWNSGNHLQVTFNVSGKKILTSFPTERGKKTQALLEWKTGGFVQSLKNRFGGGEWWWMPWNNLLPCDLRMKNQWEQGQRERRPGRAEPDSWDESNLLSSYVFSLIPPTQGCTNTSRSRLS